jgi:hypothetical protein
VRKKPASNNPRFKQIEEKLAESFGTRVHIEERATGGQLIIDFFSEDDLQTILDLVNTSLLRTSKPADHMLQQFITRQSEQAATEETPVFRPVFAQEMSPDMPEPSIEPQAPEAPEEPLEQPTEGSEVGLVQPVIGELTDAPLPNEPKQDDEDMYSISRFTI